MAKILTLRCSGRERGFCGRALDLFRGGCFRVGRYVLLTDSGRGNTLFFTVNAQARVQPAVRFGSFVLFFSDLPGQR